MKVFLALLLFYSPPLLAEKFQGRHLDFELPFNWSCQRKALEWICRPNSESEKKEAIIILSTGLKQAGESFDGYKKKYGSPISYQLPNKKTFRSKVEWSKFITLHDQRWFAAYHLGSEIPNFYTRYLFTLKNKVSTSFSFSVRKSKIKKYQSQMEKTFQSIVLKI